MNEQRPSVSRKQEPVPSWHPRGPWEHREGAGLCGESSGLQRPPSLFCYSDPSCYSSSRLCSEVGGTNNANALALGSLSTVGDSLFQWLHCRNPAGAFLLVGRDVAPRTTWTIRLAFDNIQGFHIGLGILHKSFYCATRQLFSVFTRNPSNIQPQHMTVDL